MTPPLTLTIAGFDPSGGAGILADIKTFHALGTYGTAVITALTAQNVHRVAGIEPVSLEFIKKELDLLNEVYPLKHAKTGMLYSKEIVKLVARKTREFQLQVVVDPVMVAGSGGKLSQKGLLESFKKELLPQAQLVTPNIMEAQELSGVNITNEEDALRAAEKIAKICPVVVTGGHLEGRDIFYNGSVQVIDGEILESSNTHGSGCTYSAAVTALLARGMQIEDALVEAAFFVKKAIKRGSMGTLNQWSNAYFKP
ncbi:MAG TPA: bifunctional hydroxymethylpyrimidine kinase/phosphomethylpyrimidine kinase [Methanobacteriaceae archaeon]|nr:bifunctional hydroxymethylpyrimidine kinase/phosphomethylpyrimidine kinase [Methanobacteriaceae archaeon]